MLSNRIFVNSSTGLFSRYPCITETHELHNTFTWYNQGNSKCFHSVATKDNGTGQRVRGPTWVVEIVKIQGGSLAFD